MSFLVINKREGFCSGCRTLLLFFGNSVLEIREFFKYNDFNNEGQAHRFF